jgi:penicillin amidase
MDRERTRRAVLGALLAGGVVGAAGTPIRRYLDRFAPFGGDLWDTAGDDLPETVESPYGAATVRYDDHGVPHVSADDERALYFAVGYVQGVDRLFQMDLQRRQMRGELSAVVGDATLASDRFHVLMDFAGAAEASWQRVEGTETGDLVTAYTEGVNRHVDSDRPLPIEYDLLGFEPEPWTPADAMLAEKQIGWTLTGRFRTLREATVTAALGPDVAETLFPTQMDHEAAILRDQSFSADTGWTTAESGAGGTDASRSATAVDPDLVDWLGAFESPRGIGSNSWVVSGEHTASGSPLLANDPHLSLMAPPVWYEMHLTGPETDVRGVTFPGVPFVVIGENDAGAWGFTNTGTDVIDFYEYDTRDGQYRYGEEWRDFETEQRTIAVADGDDRTVTVRKTVHGPMLGVESDGDEFRTEVAVAWTGLGATRTTAAVSELNRSEGLDDALSAVRKFDLPTQNFVYADRDGNTHYRVVGKVPIRRTAGEAVRGDRVFDGSAREGEWAGYTPYGETEWDGDGFIAFEEMPHVDQPEYLGTANQRVLPRDDDYPYYFEKPYSTPFRGLRLWERLDERVASDEAADPAFMRRLQRDVYDKRAEQFVPVMLDVRDDLRSGSDARALLDELDDWDYRMSRDARGALIFEKFMQSYRHVVFGDRLEQALGERRNVSAYYGTDWSLIQLPPDSAWFSDGRPEAIRQALSTTAVQLDKQGWETYGDYNVTAIDHPFDRSWLNYPRYATDGSGATLNNFHREEQFGSSWRMICPMDKSAATSEGAFPGGNDGSVFSDHYHDQLRAWADGEYKPIPLGTNGEIAVRFEEGER